MSVKKKFQTNIDFIRDINKKNYEAMGYNATDKFMLRVLWCHFFFLLLYSFFIYFFKPAQYYPSPYSWREIELVGVLTVITLGLIANLIMTYLRQRIKKHYFYRFLVANALMMYSYLFVYITGGSIEAHFHFFIMIGLLTLYFDWRLSWFAVITVALHHGILNYLAPHWVYFYGRNDIAFTAHALLVLVMALYATKVAEKGRKSVEDLKKTNIELRKNIVARKRSEKAAYILVEDLNETLEKLKEIDIMKSQFLSVTSHELKTPITPIRGQLQLIIDGMLGKVNKKQKASLDVVKRNVLHLEALIDDILDISKLQANKMKFIFERESITGVIKESVENQQDFAKERNVKLKSHILSFPEMIIDPERIRQLVTNLTNNAIKFSDEGGTVFVETQRSKDEVLIMVHDEGLGIEKEDADKLFKPFSQIDSSQRRRHEGTGLGLAICKGIVTEHDGKIWFKSKGHGKGTTFYIQLPIKSKKTEKKIKQ